MLKIYLLPAIIFQITIIAGGYGTGQEFVQFFLIHGAKEGLLGLITAGFCWAIVCMLSFRCAVQWQSYDYKTFFKNLLGERWWLFEVSYLLLMFIVLAVVAASVGSLGQIMLGTSYNTNISVMVIGVGLCVYLGSKFIEKTFTFTSIAIMITYLVFTISCFKEFNKEISYQLASSVENSNWIFAGIKYAGYNLGLIPAVFFSLRYIKTKRQALISGAIAGIWAVIPGILFYIAMLGMYPEIMQETIPSMSLLASLNNPLLSNVFSVVLFTTLVQTSISLVHSLNERIEVDLVARSIKFHRYHRLIIGLIVLCGAMVMAQFGLAPLIKHGYGVLTWVIIAIYIAPLLLRSVYSRFA